MAVFACVRAIAQGVAQAPLKVYRQLPGGGKEEARNVTAWRLLHRRPNPWQTSYEFRMFMAMHAALTGDAFAFKATGEGRQVRQLIPLLPSWVSVNRSQLGDPIYTVATPIGISGVFSSAQILHLRCPGWDWIRGVSAMRVARNAIGLSMAAEEYHAKLHQNGGRPAGVLQTDQSISEDKAREIGRKWVESFGGSAKAFKTAVLDAGWKYQMIASTGVDTQHLETRRHQVEEICRAFNVFPQIIMHTDKASTYASAEAFFAAHIRQTVGPWIELLEQLIDEFVLDQPGPLFCRFDTRELTKANIKDRAVAMRSLAELGIYIRNEIREMEGLSPLPGVDEPLTPMNMGSAQPEEPSDEAQPSIPAQS